MPSHGACRVRKAIRAYGLGLRIVEPYALPSARKVAVRDLVELKPLFLRERNPATVKAWHDGNIRHAVCTTREAFRNGRGRVKAAVNVRNAAYAPARPETDRRRGIADVNY